MRHISFILYIFIISQKAFSIDMEILKYLNKNNNDYFKGHTNVEINKFCESGSGGTVERNFCLKIQYEISEEKLKKTYSIQKKLVEKNDKYLKENKNPISLPLYIKEQDYWERFRNAKCEGNYISVGPATGRIAEYFECLTNMTIEREKELSNK